MFINGMKVFMEKRMCRKCLLQDLDQKSYYKTIYKLIENIEEDIKSEKALYEERLFICRTCSYLREGICGACGCFVELRAAVTSHKCPYKKW